MADSSDLAEVGPGTTGFSSFPASFFAAVQQQATHASESAKLQAVASRYLESSSSESDTDLVGGNKPARDHAPTKVKSKRRKHSAHDKEEEKIMRMEARIAASGQGRTGTTVLQNLGLGLGGSSSRDPGMYYDTRGDKQALIYEALYAADKAVYSRKDPLGVARGLKAARMLAGLQSSQQPRESGSRYFHAVHTLAERNRKNRRLRLAALAYAPKALHPQLRSASTASAVTRSTLHRSLPLPEYISLSLDNHSTEQRPGVAAMPAEGPGDEAWVGESADEYVLRMTREFNVAVREKPGDVELWMRYAAFQDEAAAALGRGASRTRAATVDAGAVAEKKAAILERGLQHSRSEPRLLLALLDAAAPLLDAEGLNSRWIQVIRRWQALDTHNCAIGTAMLWSEYLRLRREQFALFRVPRLQGVYVDGLASISQEAGRLERSGESGGQSDLLAVELASVVCTLDLVDMELQAGHTDMAVARIQALLEFHCCNPVKNGGSNSSHSQFAQMRMFGAFWDSWTPRIGDEGAQGWAAWYRKQHSDVLVEAADPKAREDQHQAEQAAGGGWSGWVELPVPPAPPADESGQQEADKVVEGGLHGSEAQEASVGTEEGEVEGQPLDEAEGEEPEMTEEELMAQLGLKLEQELEGLRREGVNARVLRQWAADEWRRSLAVSFPAREPPSRTEQVSDGEEGCTGMYVDTEDVEEVLMPLRCTTTVEVAVMGCLALLGAPVGYSWVSSNQRLLLHGCPRLADPFQQRIIASAGAAPAATQAAAGGAAPWAAAGVEGLGLAHGRMSLSDPWPGPWYVQSEARRAFVARTLQTLTASGMLFEQHPAALSAYLLVEAATATPTPPTSSCCVPGGVRYGELERMRAAAKALLATQRTNLAAWGAFAQLESCYGSSKVARNISEVTLAGVNSLPAETCSSHLPAFILAFAQSELMQNPGHEADARALHVLAWFLSGLSNKRTVYQPYRAGTTLTSAAHITAARKGVGAALPGIAGRCASGQLQAPDAHTLVAVGLLEVLAARVVPGSGSGLADAVTIFKNTVGTPKSELHSSSPHFEWLQVNYCAMLVREEQRALQPLSPKVLRQLLLQALAVYPNSMYLTQLLLIVETRVHAAARLRQYLHSVLADRPTDHLFALAAQWEVRGAATLASARAVLERGVTAKVLAHSPTLWIMYLRFEEAHGNAASLRRVALRAIRECPGCKAVWMEVLTAAGAWAELLPPREVSGLLMAMQDKGLKVHVDIMEAAMHAMETG